MSEKTLYVTNKICATCDRYSCDRTPSGGGFIKVKGDTGKCYLFNHYSGTQKAWGATCNSWEPWGILKGWVK